MRSYTNNLNKLLGHRLFTRIIYHERFSPLTPGRGGGVCLNTRTYLCHSTCWHVTGGTTPCDHQNKCTVCDVPHTFKIYRLHKLGLKRDFPLLRSKHAEMYTTLRFLPGVRQGWSPLTGSHNTLPGNSVQCYKQEKGQESTIFKTAKKKEAVSTEKWYNCACWKLKRI